MLIMRHPHSGAASFLANKLNSYYNTGDGSHEHPTQALLDTFSIREKLGSIKGKKVVLKRILNIQCLSIFSKAWSRSNGLWSNYINPKILVN